MFDIGWGELVVIGIVALIAIGPKELPTVLRSLGQWIGKIRHMAAEFQGQFQEALREAEVADLKKQAEDLTSTVTGFTSFDPMANAQKDVEKAFELPAAAKTDETKTGETKTDTATPAAERPPGWHVDIPIGAAHSLPTPSAELPGTLPPIDVPPPEAPAPLRPEDFAASEPPSTETPKEPSKQAGGGA
jgi:sec-independent protein translocase protein TatB